MKRRSARMQLALGVIIALLAVAAVPIVWFSARDGIEAVRSGDGAEAIELGLVALVAAALPVLAAGAYAHWLWVTSRPREPHEPHVPSRAEDWLVGLAVAVVCLAAWPIGQATYRESLESFQQRQLTSGALYGLLGICYLAFALFCLVRYVRWMR